MSITTYDLFFTLSTSYRRNLNSKFHAARNFDKKAFCETKFLTPKIQFLKMSLGTDEFEVRCHCGKVTGRFRCCSSTVIPVIQCNCSDCGMRRNDHYIIPAQNFVNTTKDYESNTTLYEWGTQTAKRRFCRTCGILPWYQPRSNPEGIAITVACVDWTKGNSRSPPKLEVEEFDGIHWEESFAMHNAIRTNEA